MTRAYCPKCDTRVVLKQFPLGEEGLVDACAGCDNVMVYDHRDQYLQRERDRLERFRSCGHETDRRHSRDACRYCQLPESKWDEPKTVVEPDALDFEPSPEVRQNHGVVSD